MVATTALFLVALAGAGSTPNAPTPTLRLDPAVAAPSPWSLQLALRSDAFGIDTATPGANHALAQAATAASATNPPTPEAAGGSAPACAEECDIDCETCRESDRQARYVMRRRARTLRTHRAFAFAAWGSLLVTEVFGTIHLLNQASWFGDGACRTSPDRFGCGDTYNLVSGLHQTFAFTTAGLYTAAGVIAATAPDPDNASVGNDLAARTLRRHKTLAWVHAAGMVLMPILGVLSANPDLVGVSDEGRDGFVRGMRSVHALVGYTTFAAFTAAGILEL